MGSVDLAGAGWAGPGVAEEHAGVAAAPGQQIFARGSTRVRQHPGVKRRILLLYDVKFSCLLVCNGCSVPRQSYPTSAESEDNFTLSASQIFLGMYKLYYLAMRCGVNCEPCHRRAHGYFVFLGQIEPYMPIPIAQPCH